MFDLVIPGKGINFATPHWLASSHIACGELIPILPEWKISDLPICQSANLASALTPDEAFYHISGNK